MESKEKTMEEWQKEEDNRDAFVERHKFLLIEVFDKYYMLVKTDETTSKYIDKRKNAELFGNVFHVYTPIYKDESEMKLSVIKDIASILLSKKEGCVKLCFLYRDFGQFVPIMFEEEGSIDGAEYYKEVYNQ